MQKRILCFSMLILVLGFSSCQTSKDLVYMQNAEGEEVQIGLPAAVPEYRIKPIDNLYVNIQTLNPEVNMLFNPGEGGGSSLSTQQMYGQLSAQYLNGYLVDGEGKITLPILGKVHVAEMTTAEAQDHIQLKANEYLKEATVNVKLLSFKVTVMGEVKNPGVYYNYNKSLTVFEAISIANGITDYARIKKVLVVRPTANGSKTFRLDLSQKEALGSEAFYLLPNDVLYVEPDKYKNVKLNSPVYSLLLSTISTFLLVWRTL